jgi:hypothetical protein
MQFGDTVKLSQETLCISGFPNSRTIFYAIVGAFSFFEMQLIVTVKITLFGE